MSRVGTQDTVIVKPANNIYTVLTLVAFLVAMAAFAALWIRAGKLFEGGLFS